MKSYDDVKKASDEAIAGLIEVISNSLSEEDADRLLKELAMSLFTSTLDFDLPIDEFVEELNRMNFIFQQCMLKSIMDVKIKIDEGDRV